MNLPKSSNIRKNPHGVVVSVGNSSQSLNGKINNDLCSPLRKKLMIDNDPEKSKHPNFDDKPFSRYYVECCNNSPQLV